jgi:putative copper resistance protein D
MALLALLSGCLFAASLACATTDRGPGSSVAGRLVTIGAVAALYGVHGWALAQQADQLPDARRREWLITVGQPWDQPVLAVVEPAGAAMWVIAASTLFIAAAVVLYRARRRRTPGTGRRVRSASERAHDLVMSSEP